MYKSVGLRKYTCNYSQYSLIKKKFYLKFYFCILRQSLFFLSAVSFPIANWIPYMCYLNCSRPEMFDEFFMNGFHLLLFWSDVSYLWWLIKQWIITALAITCDKNMAWVQMTGIFFYITILLLDYIRRRYLMIKKNRKKLEWTCMAQEPWAFLYPAWITFTTENIHHKIPRCAMWQRSRFVWPSMSSQCIEVAQARRVTGRVDGQLPPS